MKRLLAVLIILLFVGSGFAVNNEFREEDKNERVFAKIIYRSNECSLPTLQPIVVITQPQDGAVVTDPNLVVRGYASDENGMNYWEWEWHYKGGSYSNSSYFETAQYVEFRIDIYGLHPGWNLIIVRFKNIYGAMGEDSVNVTYNPPNNPPNKPTKPEGPTSGKVKETLYFNTVTTDPDGDSLEYLIDWGDGTNTGWLGPITSGTPFQNFHAWDEPGTYEVKAKARDLPYLEESEWSEPLIVTIYKEENDTEPPVVIKEYPPDGATFTEPNITAWGYITDNVGVVSYGYTHEWEGGATGSSWPLEEPTTNYSFEIPITLHEGWNRIRIEASDAAGNYGYDEETVTYVVEDTIPPTTTLVVGEPKYFKEEEEMWYVTSETPFTLVAQDNEGGSGVNYTLYRIWYLGNWSDWTKYEETFYLTEDGPHYIEFYSVDYEGNIETINNYTYYVDSTPPITVFSKDCDNTVTNRWALIFVSADTAPDQQGRLRPTPGMPAQGLQAYHVLRYHHNISDDRIFFALWHNDFNQVSFDRTNRNQNAFGGRDFNVNTRNDNPVIDCDHNKIYGNQRYNCMRRVLQQMITDLANAINNARESQTAEVIIYLVGHGGREGQDYYFNCEDTGQNCPSITPQRLNGWLNQIQCQKMVILLDFCNSGGFIQALQARNRIIVTSTDESHYALFPNVTRNCGFSFFNVFWQAINGGATIQNAFNAAWNDRHGTQNRPPTFGRLQNPQIWSGANANPNNCPVDPENVGRVHRCILEGIDYGNFYYTYEGEIFDPVGVSGTHYRIDGGEWKEYTTPFSINSEGAHVVECYSTDYLGNKEIVKVHHLYVDYNPPENPKLLSPSDEESVTNTPSFDWSDVEDISDVYYTLQVATDESFNNIVFERKDIIGSEYIMNKSEALSMGTYYWRVKAVDGVNNSGEWSDVWSFTVTKENNPPDKPSKPVGPTTGKFNVSYTYSSSTTDTDGDKIQYCFDWGDGTFTWTDWYDSGEIVNASHTWYEKGTYQIKVKAMDIHGYESEWSDPLPIKVPYSFDVKIGRPEHGCLYIFGNKIIPLRHTIIIGPLEFEANGNELSKVEFYIDGKLKYVDYTSPYSWFWDEFIIGRHEIKIVAYDFSGNIAIDKQEVWIFNV